MKKRRLDKREATMSFFGHCYCGGHLFCAGNINDPSKCRFGHDTPVCDAFRAGEKDRVAFIDEYMRLDDAVGGFECRNVVGNKKVAS